VSSFLCTVVVLDITEIARLPVWVLVVPVQTARLECTEVVVVAQTLASVFSVEIVLPECRDGVWHPVHFHLRQELALYKGKRRAGLVPPISLDAVALLFCGMFLLTGWWTQPEGVNQIQHAKVSCGTRNTSTSHSQKAITLERMEGSKKQVFFRVAVDKLLFEAIQIGG